MPFVCKVCKKLLKSRSALCRHRKIHVNYMFGKFNCDICEKKFQSKSRLSRHFLSKEHIKKTTLFSEGISNMDNTNATEPGTPLQDETMQTENSADVNSVERAYSPVSAVGEEGPSVETPMFRVVPLPSFVAEAQATKSENELIMEKLGEMDARISRIESSINAQTDAMIKLVRAGTIESMMYNRDLITQLQDDLKKVFRDLESKPKVSPPVFGLNSPFGKGNGGRIIQKVINCFG